VGIAYYGWNWEKFSDAADIIIVGDVDDDSKADLIGVWSSGLWVKFSSTLSWRRLTILPPNHIDVGLFRIGTLDTGVARYLEPVGGYAEGLESITDYQDFADQGPGGRNFVFHEEKNLIPQETNSQIINRSPGPGEPGLVFTEQKNLVPKEGRGSGKKKEK
jgi:hypothetical protein